MDNKFKKTNNENKNKINSNSDSDLANIGRVYELLIKVYSKKAYSAIELNKALELENLSHNDKSYITMLFYGVLDKSIQFDYIIENLVKKSPKPNISIILKIGFYLLKYSNSPDYAVVNKVVEFSKTVGKEGVSGFINAVLKKSVNFILPKVIDIDSLSISASYPKWIVEKLVNDYGFDFTKELLLYENSTLTHIRVCTNIINEQDFINVYDKYIKEKSSLGYYIDAKGLNNINKTHYTIQSLASMIAVNCYNSKNFDCILDLCSAPGGKAVYLKELQKNTHIIACDLHEHRTKLIKKYANRCGVELDIFTNNAIVLNQDFVDEFDCVICDVPCSGIGVKGSKPEIIFNKTQNDIDNIAKTQINILKTASKYVKVGGELNYSTCTIFKQENDDIINQFLKENTNFKLVKIDNAFVKSNDDFFVRLFPHTHNTDGFFIAKLERVF